MKTSLLTALLLTALPVAAAQTYSTADEVVAAMDAQPEPDSSNSSMTMVITSGSGQSLSRSMESWAKGENSIVKFTGPADIEGSGFLTLDDGSGDEESYLWLPALGRVRRLATSGDDQDGAFFGSDFTYEDLDFDIDDWAFTLLEAEGGNYVMEGTPAEGVTSQYSKVVITVPEDTLVPSRAELYKDGELAKVQTISEVAEIGEYRIAASLKMETLATGSFTTIDNSDYVLDEEVPDDVFTERFLQQ